METTRAVKPRVDVSSNEEFERATSDPNVHIVTDFSAGGDTVLIAFGGMAGRMGIPPFEFFAQTADIPVKRVFVRDVRQMWFQLGVPGIASNFDELAGYLKAIMDRERPRRIVVVGNCAGGFAALVSGFLLEADAVHGFGPATTLNPFVRFANGNTQWGRSCLELYLRRWGTKVYTDVASLLRSRPTATQFHIHYGRGYRHARNFCRRLTGYPNVHTHAYDYDKHAIARFLRDRGVLKQILTRAVAPHHGEWEGGLALSERVEHQP